MGESSGPPPPEKTSAIPRRDALKIGGLAVGGAIAVAVGVPLVGAAVGSALKPTAPGWMRAGAVDAFPEGEVLLAIIEPPVDTEWPALDAKMAVYVRNDGRGGFTVFDMHCTHVGCPVRWVQTTQRFFSPCHGGVFDSAGRVLGGPPPRPLDRREYKVEDGLLYVGAVYRVNEQLQRIA